MHAVPRDLAKIILDSLKRYPAIVLTGPRRAGKTYLLRTLLPSAEYILLEDPDIQARVQSDPRSFLESLKKPVILDEIQNTPLLFNYIRTLIDRNPKRTGDWLFTGSQEAPLMQGISESMAGRALILQLLPMSKVETPRVSLLHGGYPEVLAAPRHRQLWFSSYIQTYLERDVRQITQVRDLPAFRRFMALIAARHGQILNRADIAGPLGVSVPTVSEWLHILEITAQILIIPPFFENFGKRIIKSPKVYWADSGMACHLLGIQTQAELDRSPFLGAVFEGYAAAEILKSQTNQGLRKELYYFRDQQGLEIDFVLPRPQGKIWLAECKATRTLDPKMARPMQSLAKAAGKTVDRSFLIYRKSRTAPEMRTIAPGVDAVHDEELTEVLQNIRVKAARS